MTKPVIIESECAVMNLDFPAHLDHAWLFIAEGIHLRLFKTTADDTYIPEVIQKIECINLGRYVLTIGDSNFWSDGAPITTEEVINVLLRGQQAGVFLSIHVAGRRKIEVAMANEKELTKELIASPLFTITPSCRSPKKSTATCGPYVLISSSENKRIMIFRKREQLRSHQQCPKEITIIVTENRSQGIRLLKSGHITLSCPLGAEPLIFSELQSTNKISNRLTNLGLVLKPYPGSFLSKNKKEFVKIGESIQREKLAYVTSNTLVPLFNFSALFAGTSNVSSASEDLNSVNKMNFQNQSAAPYCGPKVIELGYAPFEPNYQIAHEIGIQLRQKNDIHCSLTEISYKDYVACRYPRKEGFSLEIIQPLLPEDFCRMKWDFLDVNRGRNSTEKHLRKSNRTTLIPLLQNTTSLISFDSAYKNLQLLTKEALLDWSKL